MLSQRVDNIRGVFALENSSFGYINEQKHIWGGNSGKIEGYETNPTQGRPVEGSVHRSLYPDLA